MQRAGRWEKSDADESESENGSGQERPRKDDFETERTESQ